MSRWVKLHYDGVGDSQHIYPPITALEVVREKRKRSQAISVHPPGYGAMWPNDRWLTDFARRRPLRYRPWKVAR